MLDRECSRAGADAPAIPLIGPACFRNEVGWFDDRLNGSSTAIKIAILTRSLTESP